MENPAIEASPSFCALHADDQACEDCIRCGAFACERCRRVIDGDVLCRLCAARKSNRPPSPQAKTALALAWLGFVGVLPGLVGGVLGWTERRRIARGDAPASGLGYAELARSLGIFYLCVLAVGMLWGLSRLLE